MREYIFDRWQTVARRYAFQAYDGPPLEPLDLYTAKSGEEIVGQLYNFTDKGERAVSMRPEMTPTHQPSEPNWGSNLQMILRPTSASAAGDAPGLNLSAAVVGAGASWYAGAHGTSTSVIAGLTRIDSGII